MTGRALLSRAAIAAAIVTWGAAAAALVAVAVGGPLQLPGLTLDRLTTALVVLVTGVAAIVVAFSVRYLQDDARLGRFLALVAVTTAGTVVFATAASLTVLVAGWLVAGAGFCLLLAHGPAAAAGRRVALRRTVAAFAVGDLALVTAAGVALVAVGDLDLRRTDEAAAALATAGVAGPVAMLLVVAALARCAQLPLHRWLPATVAAPTPVSALLHAGLVNAGGILLVRLGPVVGLSTPALVLLLAAGAATAVVATAAMLARPDVKGALAHSTMAQMGFMLVQVALGAAAAAVVHLVGHAMYKAALFLGSGSAVGARRRRAAAPVGAPLRPGVRAAAALGLPLAALAAALAAAGGPAALGGPEVALLLAFAWASGAHAVDGWLRAGPPAALATSAAATLLAAAAYVGLLAGAKAFLEGALPAAIGLGPWLAASLAAAVVVVTAARLVAPAAAGVGAGARATAYAWLIESGAVRLAPTRPARARTVRGPALARRRVAGVTP